MSYKLLQINTVVNSGSTGRIAEEIGKNAIYYGWDSYIAFGRNERPSNSKLIKIGNSIDIKLHGLRTRIFDSHGLGSIKATKELIKEIEKIEPSIIHLHNLHGYYLNIEILFKYLATSNIPIIWTLHDCWAITGHCSHFDYIGCEKWKQHCFKCPQKKEYPASFIFDRSKKNFELKKELFGSVNRLTIVTVSKWLQDIISQSFLSDKQIKTIYNGIDLDVFKPHRINNFRDKYNLLNKFIILGVASNWTPRKGLADFIKLSTLVDQNVKIILIGLNDSQLKNLPKNIIGIKRTDNSEELAEIYSNSDVFINPTFEDSFPTTNLESIACGTPVITYNTGGSKESLNSNIGFVVNKGDINGIINVINIIKDKGKKNYSENCIKHACLNYNYKDRCNDYMNLYHSILTSG